MQVAQPIRRAQITQTAHVSSAKIKKRRDSAKILNVFRYFGER
jgi:hypothetical protein